MADYNDILSDPTNPIVVTESLVTFPKWLTSDVLDKSKITLGKNMSMEDYIIRKHASYYDATIWYSWVKEFSPKSYFVELTQLEVQLIIEKGEFERKEMVMELLNSGYNFVKTTNKSSHRVRRVITFEDFLEEITHPNLVMSFKRGCTTLFFRKYIDDIQNEFRVYFHQNKIKYMEEYIHGVPQSVKELVEFAKRVNEKVRYEDYVLDFCFSATGGFIVIEINTPFYLLGGLHLCSYKWYLDKIHNSEPVFLLGGDEVRCIDILDK
jgi:hypothetical protein